MGLIINEFVGAIFGLAAFIGVSVGLAYLLIHYTTILLTVVAFIGLCAYTYVRWEKFEYIKKYEDKQ
jgi:uncharacterized membrane protein YfcA